MKTGWKRTGMAVVLFVPLAALLITMLACLPAPVGDPEKSKVDEKLLGVWQPVKEDADSKTALLMKKWDDRTYVLLMYAVKNTDGKLEYQSNVEKCWLTTLGGAPFITMEPMDPVEKITWTVCRYELAGDTIKLRPILPDNALLKDALRDNPTRETLEKIITAHVNDEALYPEPAVYKKVPEDKVKSLLDEVQGKTKSQKKDLP